MTMDLCSLEGSSAKGDDELFLGLRLDRIADGFHFVTSAFVLHIDFFGAKINVKNATFAMVSYPG